MNTKRIGLILVFIVILSSSISITSIGLATTVRLDIVELLEEKALNKVVRGDSHVDPGDFTLEYNGVVIGLWKRIYGYGCVNVTHNGVLVKAAFSKASMGMAGIYIRFLKEPLSFNASIELKIVEDQGGVIELVLHNTWDNGVGGDKPGRPLTQVIVYPKFGLALIGKTQKNIGRNNIFKIEVSFANNTSVLSLNGMKEKVYLDSSPTYITLMALSTDPGLNMTFLVEEFDISYSINISYPITKTTTTIHTTTTSYSANTINNISVTQVSINSINTVENSTTTKTTKTTNTGEIISNATITIVYPNGTTQTSIVPVTRKPVSSELITPLSGTATPISKSTSSVEGRVFNMTFYMILLVAVIVIVIASLVFSRKR